MLHSSLLAIISGVICGVCGCVGAHYDRTLPDGGKVANQYYSEREFDWRLKHKEDWAILYPEHIDERAEGEPMPHFDAWLTWQGSTRDHYDGYVEFIWNGEKLGRDTEGFGQLLRKLNAMPTGATILVYPLYTLRTPSDSL